MVGEIITFAGSVIPEGYLLCDGSSVSRDTYSELFEVIGTTYGEGDGVTTFGIPDLLGRVAMGDSVSHVLGSNGGESTHTLDTNEISVHVHTVPSHGHANTILAKTPALSHSITQPAFKYTKLNGTSAGTTGYTVAAWTGTSTKTMSRSTNVSVSDHAATACTMSGGVTDCAALTTDSAGSDGSHNNMMPYMSLTYLIRYEPEVRVPRMLMFNGCMPCAPSGAYLQGRK